MFRSLWVELFSQLLERMRQMILKALGAHAHRTILKVIRSAVQLQSVPVGGTDVVVEPAWIHRHLFSEHFSKPWAASGQLVVNNPRPVYYCMTHLAQFEYGTPRIRVYGPTKPDLAQDEFKPRNAWVVRRARCCADLSGEQFCPLFRSRG